MINSILKAREDRANYVRERAKSSPVITVKANIPGDNKNTPYAKLLVLYVAKEMQSLGAENLQVLNGSDGIVAIGEVKDGVSFKRLAVDFEENNKLGRFTDIDVFLQSAKNSLSRGSLRKCYLCEKPAAVCARENNHSIKKLVKYFNDSVIKVISSELKSIVKSSMTDELNLTQKFGLVSKTENGSHKDLNYATMKKAIKPVCICAVECFKLGLNASSLSGLFSKLQPLGVKAEREMFKVTFGANAYKGFIFISGILMAAVGYIINNGLSIDKVFSVSKEILKEFNITAPQNTFGFTASENGFGGIRKEAKSGFSIIGKAEKLLNEGGLLYALSRIVGLIDDSVLLKRAKDTEKYEYYKKQISSVNVSDKNAVKKLNEECVKDNISIGGSADILIATIMLKKIKEKFLI